MDFKYFTHNKRKNDWVSGNFVRLSNIILLLYLVNILQSLRYYRVYALKANIWYNFVVESGNVANNNLTDNGSGMIPANDL